MPDLTSETPLVLVALGSNLGDSSAIIQTAMDCLERMAGALGRRSSLWSTSPIDCPPESPDFINAAMVLRISRGVTPEAWLLETQALERRLGRRPKAELNEARPLDIDLIAWGQETRATSHLILPHPRAYRRRFVLQPLAELVPDLVLLGQSLTVAQLLEKCPADPHFKCLTPRNHSR